MQNEIANALISRFDAHNDRVPHEIKALEQAGVIRVRLHLAYKAIVSFPEAETIPWTFYYDAESFEGPMPDAALIEQLEPHLPAFMLQQARMYIDFTQTSFELQTQRIFSDVNLFYRLAGFLADKLDRNAIDIVLFDEVPHYGMDFLLFHVAQAKGIRTLIFLQNVHTERSIVVEHWAEIGNLMANPVLAEPMETEIERRFEKDLYAPVDLSRNALMTQVKEMNARQIKLGTPFVLVLSLVYYSLQLLLKPLLRGRHRPMGTNVNRGLHPFIGREIRKAQACRTLESIERFAVKNPDLDTQFVYFALHMQPEATTHPMGGAYGDQLLAIESLARMLPEDCSLYVKEHPDDRGQLRDPHFYMRLAAIPRTQLITANVNSHDLMARCLFVATVTGTCGWEAITGGKPALTFGHAWYNDLPGVFKFADSPRFEDIVSYKVEHTELQARFAELSQRFGDFTPAWGLEPHQFPKGLDRAANAARFTKTMQPLITGVSR